MTKQRVVDKIYDAFKLAARGKPEVALQHAVNFAVAQTSMPDKLVRMYLPAMEATGMINVDGHTVWLVQDFGPRQVRPDTFELAHKAELRRMKGERKIIRAHLGKIARAKPEKRR